MLLSRVALLSRQAARPAVASRPGARFHRGRPRRLDALMSRLSQGERRAFDPLFRALYPRAVRLARVKLSEDHAADAAQSIMMKVFSRASEFEVGRPVLPWFYAVAANELHTLRRRSAADQSRTVEESLASHVAAADDPEQLLSSWSANFGSVWSAPSNLCPNPTPLLIRGVDTGFDTCAQGTLRRRAVVDCPSFLPRVDGGGPCMARGNFCSFDSDCAADAGWGTLATCNQTFECFPLGVAGHYCNCSAGCIRDSDCGPGSVCFCGDPVGQCLPATCTSGGSCASGCDCINPLPAPEQALSGMFFSPRFDRQTPTDECAGASDCCSASEGLFCGDNGNGHTCFGGGACME